jgi:RND superfamily putative drug exporter
VGSIFDPLEDHRLFAALGRFTVRYRWPIIAAWIAATVVLVMALPSLSSVEKSSNSQFLPASSASVRAGELAAPFHSDGNTQAAYVASTTGGRSLSPADTASINRVERVIRALPWVAGVIDQGVSADGTARIAVVDFNVPASSKSRDTARVVAEVRAAFKTAGTPGDLVMHLTGGAAQSVDQHNQSGHTQTLTEVLSLLFILGLLFLTFRALLAPFVALFPSVVALFAAGPLVAQSTHIGVQVSDLTPILLTVVMLGAGTDYGLFLIFRVREELRRGRPVGEAVAFSLCKVGESITFSGLTVIAALATVVVATFGLYQGLGPGLAIGIVVALLANLTLLPALLAVLGRSVFWPKIPKVGPPRHGAWGIIAGKVVARPIATLMVGLVFFGGLGASMLAYAPTGFGDQPPPATSDSARGQRVLDAAFPSTEANPTSLVFRLPTSVWNNPGLLATIQQDLELSGSFRAVSGALDPNGGALSAMDLTRAHTLLGKYGPAAALPASPPPGISVSAAEYNDYRASALFISSDGRTIQYYATLVAGPSNSTAAAQAIPAIRSVVGEIGTSIGATASGVNGYAPVAADVGTISGHDLVRILPIVLVVLALLLAVVLRSLVAPLYLVISVGLSYLASLGLAVLVFVLLGGQDGINFVLPFFMFVFIMALGQDYNILVMTRIREEAYHAPIRVAVRRAVEATGTTVTSAGLILAGTFGVLTATGDTQVQEIGLGLAAGILLDTFFVRTLLVPSVVVLLGRWNWWPSSLSHEDHSHDPVTSETDDPEGYEHDTESVIRPLADTAR